MASMELTNGRATVDGVFFTAKQLSVGYGGNALIHDIEIELPRGQILTLIGPNGSGKSTILKTIANYLGSIAGAVYIEGDPVGKMSPSKLSRKMSVVLTERLRTELMTCRDIVETGRYPYTGRFGILSEDDHRIVREAMELVNMWELRDRDFMHISDGQRQRLMLARAICQEPDIILLDEPTSFLDIRYQVELLSILRGLVADRNISVIMSLHELDMAQKVSDKVMCVHGETIFRYGTPEEIFTGNLIEELYSLEGGSFNPVFGSVEMARPEGEPRTFVVAGGGSGARVFRKLQKDGVPFVTGVLHENDVDYALARDLATKVVGEKAFEPISDAALGEACELLDGCERLLLCLSEFGTGNARNAELVEHARQRGIEVVDACGAVAGASASASAATLEAGGAR